MLRLLCLCALIVLSHGYAIPAVHTVAVPVAIPYVSHGYAGHGYGHGFGHGIGHGLHHGHHILKRSPHYVAAHSFAPHVAPVAVSHQARVDVHSTPVVAVPIVKQIVAPLVPVPKPFGHYGAVYGSINPHVGHY